MTVALTGHPVPDLSAILLNQFDDGSKPPGILQADINRIDYGFTNNVPLSYERVTLEAFAELSDFLAVDFRRNDSNPDIALSRDNEPGGFATYGFFSTDGDLDFEVLEADIRYAPEGKSTPTDYDYKIIVHEIGHGLTLEHVHPDSFPEHEPNLPEQFQDNRYTVMHYVGNPSSSGEQFDDVRASENEEFYRHYQLLDVYALQVRFGADQNTFAGNTTHSLNQLKGDGYRKVLWDASGTDTIDTRSSQVDQIIDLKEGGFNYVANPANNTYNFAIAYDAKIERARTGSGDDDVRGNDLANQLDAGSGNDRLEGHGGNDKLNGGGGFDIAAYAGQIEDYRIEALGGGRFRVTDLDTGNVNTGRDELSGIERIAFINGEYDTQTGQTVQRFTSDFSYRPETEIPDLRVLGDRFANKLWGTNAAELIDGGGGKDNLIQGQGGDDVVIIDLHSGTLKAVGGRGDDTALFDGRIASFDLDRSGSNLWLVKGPGNSKASLKDFEVFEFADAFVDAKTGKRTSKGGASEPGPDTEPPPEPSNGSMLSYTPLTELPTNALNGTNNADRLRGSSVADLLDGRGGGDPEIHGLGGNDVIFAGAGDDRIFGGAGFDTVLFSNKSSDYTFKAQTGGTYIITDKTGDDGVDRIKAVERLEFADMFFDPNNGEFSSKTGSTDPTPDPTPQPGGSDAPLATIDYTPVTALPSRMILGGSGKDQILGTSQAELIDAGPGDDQSVKGSGGDDVFIVGTGFDKMYGQDGKDTAIFADNIEAYSGLNFNGADIHIVSHSTSGRDRLVSIETFEFKNAVMNASTGDVVFKDGSSPPTSSPDPDPEPSTSSLADLFPSRIVKGSSGENTLNGSSADEVLNAFAGDDILDAKSGDDFVIIGVGRDKNYGGSGFDIAVLDGDIGDFSGVEGVKEFYLVEDQNRADGNLGFDRIKGFEILAFDDALFDTRTGQHESFNDSGALVLRLEDLIASEGTIT